MNKATGIMFLACITLGFIVGLNMPGTGNTYIINNTGNKLDEVLNIIEGSYVDSADMNSIIEKSIPKVLEELDPHSVYIAAKDVEASNADLQSSFSGIGIRFTIQDDTIHISEVIRSGPSENICILAGYRIIKVNDTLFVGKGVCTNDAAMKKLKGEKGSFVKVSVERYGEKDLLDFNIRRDDIPVESIEAAYIIDNKWGYVQVERFAENTYAEFIKALAQFIIGNAKGVIIDVRGNGGGYLGIALEIANQFLKSNDVIVYTEGVNSPKKIERANGYGMFQEMPVVILVDETSASASEILAGTIQDNDRGTIIGRRTFGKGLVQQPFDLEDGSAMRLTIARYYTPSGRCIQKPYDKGGNSKYAMDLIDRYNRGEFFSKDSIHFNDSLVYKTKNGRTVYGGGGIMPDIFVSSDTVNMTPYAQEAFSRGLIARFALRYSDKNRQSLSNHKSHESLTSYLDTKPVMNEFIEFAKQKGLKPNFKEIEKSHKLIQRALYSNIIYQIAGMLEHVKFINLDDPTVLKAIEVLERGEAYPKAPK
jgi:carboxyl-terminal processing protease